MLKNLRRYLFGYDAAKPKGRRAPPIVSRRSEDRELLTGDRLKLISATRDLSRNFSIAAWAIRKHLDYVSTFSFQAKTGDGALDDQLEAFMAWWSLPANCDAAGRHSLSKITRLAEGHATVDGDLLINKLADGRLQGIEGDRIDSSMAPMLPGMLADNVHNGVWCNVNGRPISYAVNRRTSSGVVFDLWLPARFSYLHGYFNRFDQIRGVSPLTTAINSLRDVYENFDYALAKAKVSQLFAMAFYRDSADSLGDTATVEGGNESEPKYAVDFGGGPQKLELEPGDRAEFLESKQPSSEFQAFASMMIGVSLKALDIPFSFYDEAHTNYSGARQALLQYEQSASIKRAGVVQMLDNVTEWRLNMAVRDGDIVLPSGFRIADLNWDWVHRGVPWIDPLKEVNGDIAAIGAGLRSPQQIAKERGFDAYEVLDQIAEWQKYAASIGVQLGEPKHDDGNDQNDEANSNSGNANGSDGTDDQEQRRRN
jgi:lambda family phage portal protein